MARLLVGLPALQGDLAKYATRFDMVEIRAPNVAADASPGAPAGSLPRPATLRKWRKLVPPSFVFSVVLPPAVGALTPGPALDEALAAALEAASALEARCIVLATPPEVRPTAANRKRLAALFERIPGEGTVRCWEPSGIWEREEVLTLTRTLGVLPVLDAAREALGTGPIVYTRLRALGKSAVLGQATIERIADRVRRRREAFVVVEGPHEAQRVKTALTSELARRPGRASGVTVVRPASSTLVAEDEEQ
jgi:uncharacterized protein YecE (DUF72 family)